MLRHADASSATVWVEASRPYVAEVRCSGGAGGTSPAFRVSGRHYAIVTVTGLEPDTSPSYEVLLDGIPVWPLPGSGFPPPFINS